MLLAEAKSRNKKRYYHTSKKKFKKGKVLIPGAEMGKDSSIGWSSHGVFMTMSPMPHFTIAKEAYMNNWIVYEVVPVGKIKHGIWDDLFSDRVEIKKVIGILHLHHCLSRGIK